MEDKIHKAVFHTEYGIRIEIGVTGAKQLADHRLITWSLRDDVNMRCSDAFSR
jgi:hypothetical protein